MKSISEWLEGNDEIDEASIAGAGGWEPPMDQQTLLGLIQSIKDYETEFRYEVTCPSDYPKRVPPAYKYVYELWNRLLAASKSDKSMDIRTLRTEVIGFTSAAWHALFEAYSGWGPDYAAKKGKAFVSEFGKEALYLGDAIAKVKANKPV